MTPWPPLPPIHEASSFDDWSPQNRRLQQIVAREWRLPAFQRARCWSPERHAEYLTSVLRGEPQTPIVAWEHQGHGGPVLCLDGQHRLVTLGIALPGPPCPPLRIRLADAVAEPGEADDRETVTLARLCEFWRSRAALDYEDCVGAQVITTAIAVLAVALGVCL